MRFITLLPLASVAAANINFRWVQPDCNPSLPADEAGCLRGQVCQSDGTCIAEITKQRLASRAPRSDGRCGPQFGNAGCDANGAFGGCCSSYGYCGTTADHCEKDKGCLSGCTGGTPVGGQNDPEPAAPRNDGRCGPEFGHAGCDANGNYGGCCSSYGYCGNSALHCDADEGCQAGFGSCAGGGVGPSATGAPSSTKTTTSTGAGATTAPRTDGRCGPEFNNAGCAAGGAFGGCCSSYGYCGNSNVHCEEGCQARYGKCDGDEPNPTESPSSSSGEPVIGAPSTTTTPDPNPTGEATKDGTCGYQNNDTICGNWDQGSCCSMYGFCGRATSHCGEGCQSGDCSGPIRVRPPGPKPAPAHPNPGSLEVVGSSGVPAMHAMLMQNGRTIFLDKVEDYSEHKFPNGQYAYSSEWNPDTRTTVPVPYDTNAFCSGGIFLADGTMISAGGNGPLPDVDPTVGDGLDGIRYIMRSATDASLDGSAWIENQNKLASARWYPSLQIMGDGKIFCASGSLNGLDPTVPANNNPTFEMLNRDGVPYGGNVRMEILEVNQPYYMYPFLHLLPDGSLYVFVSRSSERFDVNNKAVLEKFDDCPGDHRTYPNSGGSIMFPLDPAKDYDPVIMVCGGGPYQDITSPTDASCGTHHPLGTAAQKKWVMESMPEGRVMVEGVQLPDGMAVWVNGASRGAQGFEIAEDPALTVLLYDYTKPVGGRFSTGPVSAIPRLYHSIAILQLDGTVMITGSNPVEMPVLQVGPGVPFITDFRVEIYTPPYLSGPNANKRPTNVVLSKRALTPGNDTLKAKFTAPTGNKKVTVSLMYTGFVTHSVHMGQRHIYLNNTGFKVGQTAQEITITAPPNHNIAPPGPYILYVLVDGIPAHGQFIDIL